MKNRLLIHFLVFIITISAVNAQETIWKPVDPGGSGWLNTAYIHPASGDLYFSSDMSQSLLRSTDKALSWVPVGNPVTGTVHGLAGDPKNENFVFVNQVSIVKEKTGIWKITRNGLPAGNCTQVAVCNDD